MANTPPTVYVAAQNIAVSHWARVAPWISYTDPESNAITQWQFEDLGTGATSAYFWTPANSQEPAGTVFTVSPSDISNVWIKGGSSTGTETMQVRRHGLEQLDDVHADDDRRHAASGPAGKLLWDARLLESF
jgi:hypothetical protein